MLGRVFWNVTALGSVLFCSMKPEEWLIVLEILTPNLFWDFVWPRCRLVHWESIGTFKCLPFACHCMWETKSPHILRFLFLTLILNINNYILSTCQRQFMFSYPSDGGWFHGKSAVGILWSDEHRQRLSHPPQEVVVLPSFLSYRKTASPETDSSAPLPQPKWPLYLNLLSSSF